MLSFFRVPMCHSGSIGLYLTTVVCCKVRIHNPKRCKSSLRRGMLFITRAIFDALDDAGSGEFSATVGEHRYYAVCCCTNVASLTKVSRCGDFRTG